ncbi:MAG: DUF4198 domain-containing protein [Desulfovibrio sp.]|nr:DUF4198 domain-containing protein [Desulfovibrio sp.]
MYRKLLLAAFLLLFTAGQASAHFGMVIPSKAIVQDKKAGQLSFLLAFAHPMEQNAMEMQKPKQFFVKNGDAKEDLLAAISPQKYLGHGAWKAGYTVKKPGVYLFGLEPEPYFEPAEDCYIVHYTKVVVPAFGEEDGWDSPLGLKTEIIPLTRPFGNYAGNVFQGKVLLDGKPCPDTVVEVEYKNDRKLKAPNDYCVTQVVKTDGNGVFTFVVPWAGWWGFAALSEGPEKMDYKGAAKDVELGAVLWTNFASRP